MSLTRSIALGILVFLLGCQEKFDLSTLPQQGETTLDTSYVELFPPFPGYEGAEDIHVGRDQLLYVADTRANRVVMMNRAGQFMSATTVLHPRSVWQDSRLDLLVGGEIVSANGDTAGAIFRIHLVSLDPDSAHHLELSRIDTVWRELARPARRFPGITVFSDNTYLAVRTGPSNTSIIDPDGRVLLFDANDRFITPLPAFATRIGSGITDLYKPTAIAAFPNSKDFVLTQSSEGVSYGAIWMIYQSTSEFEGWVPRFDPSDPVERSVDFIRPNRYLFANAVAIDPQRKDVFVADAALDSVSKFNNRGVFKSASFGYVLSGGRMRRPTGVAFFSTVLYVLDGQTGEILRYRLSTDIPR
jgi:hypothetical protein